MKFRFASFFASVIACAISMASPGAAIAQCQGLSVNAVGFTPTGEAGFGVTGTSASTALATDGSSTPAATKVVVTNTGGAIVYIVLGDSAVTSSVSTGFPIMAGFTATLSVGSATYLAAIAPGGTTAIRISTGY